MPWTAADAKAKTSKADTPKKQGAWAEIANKEKVRCEKAGEGDCEGRAVRVANAAVAKMGEAYAEWFDAQDEDAQNLIDSHFHGIKVTPKREPLNLSQALAAKPIVKAQE